MEWMKNVNLDVSRARAEWEMDHVEMTLELSIGKITQKTEYNSQT